jgi:hypothetical protein
MPNLIKIRPEGAKLFHVDRAKDMTILPVAIRNFAKAPKTKHITYNRKIRTAIQETKMTCNVTIWSVLLTIVVMNK